MKEKMIHRWGKMCVFFYAFEVFTEALKGERSFIEYHGIAFFSMVGVWFAALLTDYINNGRA